MNGSLEECHGFNECLAQFTFRKYDFVPNELINKVLIHAFQCFKIPFIIKLFSWKDSAGITHSCILPALYAANSEGDGLIIIINI